MIKQVLHARSDYPVIGKTYSLDPNQLISHAVKGKSVNFNVKENGVFAVALMPLRAFSTAREAEKNFFATPGGGVRED